LRCNSKRASWAPRFRPHRTVPSQSGPAGRAQNARRREAKGRASRRLCPTTASRTLARGPIPVSPAGTRAGERSSCWQPNVSQSGSCAPAKNMHQSKRRAQPQEDQHAQAAEAPQWCPRARDALLAVPVSTTPFVSKERVPSPPTGVGPLECVAHRVQAAAPTALGGATRESGRSRRSQAGFTLKRHVGLSCIGYPG
jgi:hypothetical protein